MQAHIEQSVGITPFIIVPRKNLVLLAYLHELLTIYDKRFSLMNKITRDQWLIRISHDVT